MDRVRTKRNFLLLAAGTFGMSFTFGVHLAIFSNFVVERIGIEPHQLGILESIRETPGFFCIFIAGLTVAAAEPRLGGLALLLYGLGLGSYAWIYTLMSLVIFSYISSIGLHIWIPLSSSMALSLAEKKHRGRRLGQLRSVAGLAPIVGQGLARLIQSLGYSAMYWTAGAVGGIGGLAVLTMSKDVGHPTKARFVLKRKYRYYYILAFLEGCRRQIFTTFALFVLVKVYGVEVQHIILLNLVNSSLTFLLGARGGKLIDRIGEYRILTCYYVGLILVFLGYGLVHRVPVLFGLYVVDNLLYLLGIALTTYLGKIADPEDVRQTLATGVTMDHIAAVIVPTAGGFLWITRGYETVFFLAAGVALVSLLVAQRLRKSG